MMARSSMTASDAKMASEETCQMGTSDGIEQRQSTQRYPPATCLASAASKETVAPHRRTPLHLHPTRLDTDGSGGAPDTSQPVLDTKPQNIAGPSPQLLVESGAENQQCQAKHRIAWLALGRRIRQ